MSVSVNTDSCLSGSPLPVLSFSSLCSAVRRPPSSASRSWSAPPLGRWWCWGCPGWWCSCWWSGTSPSCTRRSAQSLPLCSLVLSSRRGIDCKVSKNISFFYFIFFWKFLFRRNEPSPRDSCASRSHRWWWPGRTGLWRGRWSSSVWWSPASNNLSLGQNKINRHQHLSFQSLSKWSFSQTFFILTFYAMTLFSCQLLKVSVMM